MTPKEKAEELQNKYFEESGEFIMSINYARIAVEEIIDTLKEYDDDSKFRFKRIWWQTVKKEIEKL